MKAEEIVKRLKELDIETGVPNENTFYIWRRGKKSVKDVIETNFIDVSEKFDRVTIKNDERYMKLFPKTIIKIDTERAIKKRVTKKEH